MRSKYANLRWFALIVVLALVAAACGDDVAETTTTTAAPGVTTTTTTVPPGPGVTPGLGDCDINPNTCNEAERADGGTVTWVINQQWDSWNQHRPEGGSVYTLQAMDGIFPSFGRFNPDGLWVWDMDYLAEEPEVLNENPLTLQYVIRDDAVWDDGTPIGIDDMLWDWYHNSGREDQCIGCDPRSTTVFDILESIESPDGKTIIITYPEDFADAEWFARYEPSYPAHVADAQGFDWKNDPEAMGASSVFFNETVPDWSGGPYIIQSATLGERVIMEPNPAWWGEFQPTVDLLVKEMLQEPTDWLPALRNQEIDGASPASMPIDLVEQLEVEPGVHYARGSAGAVWDHLDMNMDNPFLADQVLRQAIFIAIDREDAISRIFGDLNPPRRNNHIFSQLSPFYVDHMAPLGYGTGDVAAARALLEDAGYTWDDDDNLLTPDGTAVEPIRWSFLAANQARASMAELAQNYLAEIGVPVALEPTDALGETLFGQDYDIVHFGWSGSPLFVNAPFQFWNSESGSNFGKMVDEEVDVLVAEIRNQVDIAVSAELANQASARVMEIGYVMPLWDTLNHMFVRDTIANVRDNHNSSLRSMYNLAEWGIVAN